MLPQSIRGGLVILALILVTSSVFGAQENDRGRSITVGSKNFNENYL